MDIDAFTKPFQLVKQIRRDVYPAIDPSNPDLSVSGKVVLITGAGGQIGGDIAAAWATAGAAGIVLVGRKTSSLEKTAERIKAIAKDTRVLVHSTDIVSEDSVKALFCKVAEEFKTLNVLVNNAGSLQDAKFGDIEPSKWWVEFETNVKGPFLMTHYYIKQFGLEGTVINLTTPGAGVVVPGMCSYSSSKLAALKASEYIDMEYPAMRVFSFTPGIVKSEMLKPEFVPFAYDTGALAAGFTLYLANPRADYLRGGFSSANWDVTELEQHKEEIAEKKLLHLAFLNASLGAEGHPWSH